MVGEGRDQYEKSPNKHKRIPESVFNYLAALTLGVAVFGFGYLLWYTQKDNKPQPTTQISQPVRQSESNLQLILYQKSDRR